jgi:hypothetical protein
MGLARRSKHNHSAPFSAVRYSSAAISVVIAAELNSEGTLEARTINAYSPDRRLE